MLRRFILVVITVALLFVIWGQPKYKGATDDQLPPAILHRLDSLKRSDALAEWLYTYREYVSADPVNRISILTKAQSNVWRECRADSERVEFFNCLVTQGYYLMYGGNILRSIDAYEKAYRFYFDKPLQDEDVVEYVLKPLGNNYTRLGDYDRALYIHEKALSLAKEKNDSASVYSNIAIVQRSKGELDAAKQDAENGLRVVTKNTSFHGLLLSTLADILFRQENFDEAASKILQAIAILKMHLNDEKGDAPYWLLSAYRVQGDVLSKKNDLAAAMRSYQKAIAIIDTKYKGQRKREKAQVLISLADILLKMQQQQKAIDRYNEALSLLLPTYKPATNEMPATNDLYGEYTLLDALHGKADCLFAMHKKEEALKYYLLFFVAQKKLRHEFFSRASKQLQQKDYRQVMESAMETAYELWEASGKKEYADKILLIAEMSKAQLLLDEMMSNLQYNRIKNQDTLLEKQQQTMQAIAYYEREAALNSEADKDINALNAKKELQYQLTFIQKKIKEKYPAVAGSIEDNMPSADSLLQNISSGISVIEFFTGEKSIYIIEAAKGSVKNIRKLENASEVQQAITNFMNNWFQQGPQKMINEPQHYYNDAYQIYHWLWKETTAQKDRCLIIPDGIIGYLPFDALITDSSYKADVDAWPFLIRKINLYYGYSLQTWQQQQQTKAKNKKFAGFFISFDSSKNASLPAVKKEFKEIQNTINGDFFNEQKATLKEFNDHLNQVNLLHVSTHSFLQGKENIPVLQLADDKFFLFDLYGKAFQPQLVVLSACRTGNGILAEGEGVISLARGFIAAGAGGIVAGLWNMNDESTAKLMGTFYSQLADHSPGDALHATKIKWLQQQEQKIQKLPYFWAGLTYSGGNGPVFVEKKNAVTWWWWTVAAIIMAGLFFIWKAGMEIRNKK